MRGRWRVCYGSGLSTIVIEICAIHYYIELYGVVTDDVEITNVFGEGNSVMMSNVTCNGSEKRLDLCPSARIGNHTCQKDTGSTGVICSKDVCELIVI